MTTAEVIDDYPSHPEAAALNWLRIVHGLCEQCGAADDVQAEPTRTAYAFDAGERDPNRGSQLCRPCAVDYHAYWDEMWSHVAYG